MTRRRRVRERKRRNRERRRMFPLIRRWAESFVLATDAPHPLRQHSERIGWPTPAWSLKWSLKLEGDA